MTKYSAAVTRWSESIARCMICLAPHWHVERTQISGLQKMHIIKRSKRRCDEIPNLLLGCPRCHDCEHVGVPDFPDLTLSHLLYVKLYEDGANWKPDLLEDLYCRRLPQPMPLPPEFLEARLQWRPMALPEIA